LVSRKAEKKDQLWAAMMVVQTVEQMVSYSVAQKAVQQVG
jgi:hypothetical protein